MYIDRYVYNALNRLVRRIIKKMKQLRKDVMLIVFTVILTLFTAVVPYMVKADWSAVTITWYSVVIIALIFIIWTILKGVKQIYEQEDEHQKDETKQLIKNTVEETLEELGLKR